MAVQIPNDETFARIVRGQLALHRARREDLGKMIEALEGSAPRPEEYREILSDSLDAVARARTDVEARRAMKTLQEELRAAYDAVIESEYLDDAQRASLASLAPAPTLAP